MPACLHGCSRPPLARRPGSLRRKQRFETDPQPHRRHWPPNQKRACIVDTPVTSRGNLHHPIGIDGDQGNATRTPVITATQQECLPRFELTGCYRSLLTVDPLWLLLLQQDEATRSRVHTTLLPFLKLRSPRPESIRFITDFSRRTGDLEVLSKPDVHLLALCYELEIEKNGGDWRLRRTPAQKGLNGAPPAVHEQNVVDPAGEEGQQQPPVEASTSNQDPPSNANAPVEDAPATPSDDAVNTQMTTSEAADADVEAKMQNLDLTEEQAESSQEDVVPVEPAQDGPEEEDDEDDDDGWITPSNLKKHQAKDASVAAPSEAIQETLRAALLTSDFAMQNVALRINLK